MYKYKIFYIALCVVIFSGCVTFHQAKPLEMPPVAQARVAELNLQEQELRALLPENLVLPEFEKLTYNLRWTVFNVGSLTAEIKGFKLYQGRPVYVLKLTFKSNAWLSKIFHIDSTFTSYMDAEYLYTLREEVDRKEGSYRKHAVVEYDQEAHVAYFHNYTDNSSKSFPIPEGVQDALSSVYYFRTLPLEAGKKIRYDIVIGEKVYDFHADLSRERMLSVGPYKHQQAIDVRPYAYLDGERLKKGVMTGCFSKKAGRIPLSATIKTPIFTQASAFLVDVDYQRK